MAKYTAKSFKCEKGMDGISPRQIEEHLTLYKGYVNKLGEMEDKMAAADLGTANGTYGEIRELKREEPFCTNAIYLHEKYFENLGGDGKISGKIAEQVNKDFGSFEKWQGEFRACGISGRGWVVLAWNFEQGRLHNYLMDMHDIGGIWNAAPVLVLDVYEHAYMIDYGVKRAAYLDAFFKNIDWSAAEERLKKVG